MKFLAGPLFRSFGRSSQGYFEVIGKGEYFDQMVQEYAELFLGKLGTEMLDMEYSQMRRKRELIKFFDRHIFSFIKFFNQVCRTTIRKITILSENGGFSGMLSLLSMKW